MFFSMELNFSEVKIKKAHGYLHAELLSGKYQRRTGIYSAANTVDEVEGLPNLRDKFR